MHMASEMPGLASQGGVVPRSAVVPWRLGGNNVGAGGLSTRMHRKVQDADPNEQDVILLGDFNLRPEDSGMDEVDDLLDQCSRA
jgi:hypothetical protein